jgi:hypothetical protein
MTDHPEHRLSAHVFGRHGLIERIVIERGTSTAVETGTWLKAPPTNSGSRTRSAGRSAGSSPATSTATATAASPARWFTSSSNMATAA